jgi:hypothetical protein
MMDDEHIRCEQRRMLVFSSSGGVGDSMRALTAAFVAAVTSGRMLMVEHFGTHDWREG